MQPSSGRPAPGLGLSWQCLQYALYLRDKEGMFAGLSTVTGSVFMASVQPLLSTFRVGRSAARHLYLDDPRVSQEHCVLRFARNGSWVVRDLASKNGTFVNRRPLSPGIDYPLKHRDELCFGSAAAPTFVFHDGVPAEMVVVSGGGRHTRGVAAGVGLLPLPSEDEPAGMLLRRQGTWLLETAEMESLPLSDGQCFSVGGAEYRVWLSWTGEPTAEADERPSLSAAVLHLSVSQDEEQIAAELRTGMTSKGLPARVYLYLLVLLARYRQEDAGRQLPPGEAGWRYADEVARALGVDQQGLNVQVYRARTDVEKLAFQDSSSIIERRSMTRQLRIGFPPDRVILSRL